MKRLTFPKSVKTQNAASLPPLEKRKEEIRQALTILTMEELRKLPVPSPQKFKLKNEFIGLHTELLAFAAQKDFDAWICLFPPDSQEALKELALEGCKPFEYLQKRRSDGLALAEQQARYLPPYMRAETGLGFLSMKEAADQYVVHMQPAFCDILRPWFVYDDYLSLDSCAIKAAPKTEIYNNSKEVGAALPLLCEALPAGLDVQELASSYSGLPKKQSAGLRLKTGFKPFPESAASLPDAVDLAARFIAIMTNAKLRRPPDGYEYIKELVTQFLSLDSSKTDIPNSLSWYTVEYHLLMGHFKKRAGYWETGRGQPKPRVLFRGILTHIARSGGWFSASRLARYMYLNYNTRNDVDVSTMLLRADGLIIDGVRFGREQESFYPQGIFREKLFVEPLLKGYCALFAALGILEVTWSEPEALVVTNGKSKPVSPFCALDAARITDFGRWCLGLTDERPQTVSEEYEAIADKELYLVTVRGSSFERSVYLDSIGEKLGEDRWRISPRSFIAGCKTNGDVIERVRKFRRLIDKDPAPHWTRLFDRAQERAGALNRAVAGASVFHFGDQPALFEELARDPNLASCAFRAEGGFIVVLNKHQKKFLELAAEHGITVL